MCITYKPLVRITIVLTFRNIDNGMLPWKQYTSTSDKNEYTVCVP